MKYCIVVDEYIGEFETEHEFLGELLKVGRRVWEEEVERARRRTRREARRRMRVFAWMESEGGFTEEGQNGL